MKWTISDSHAENISNTDAEEFRCVKVALWHHLVVQVGTTIKITTWKKTMTMFSMINKRTIYKLHIIYLN